MRIFSMVLVLICFWVVKGYPAPKEQKTAKGKEHKSQYNECWHKATKQISYDCQSLTPPARVKLSIEFTRCHMETVNIPLPPCDASRSIYQCAELIAKDDRILNVYTEYFIHVDNMCFYLNSEFFRERTEGLIDELVSTSENTQESLLSLLHTSTVISHNVKNSMEAQEEFRVSQSKLANTLETLHQHTDQHIDESKESFRTLHSLQSSFLSKQKEISEMQQNINAEQKALGYMQQETKKQVDEVHLSTSTVQFNLQNLVNQQASAFASVFDNLMRLDEHSTETIEKISHNAQEMNQAYHRISTLLYQILDLQQLLSWSFIDAKSFLFYLLALFLAVVMTSFQQTKASRVWVMIIYLNTIVLEKVFVDRGMFFHDQEEKIWILRKIAIILATACLFYSVHTYRNYEKVNFAMLQSIHQQISLASSKNHTKQAKE